MEKICKLCGEKFIPKTSRQAYCKKEIEKVCPVCRDKFKTICGPNTPTTCSKPECKKKAGYVGSIAKKRICKICGSEFIGTSSTQEYCNKPVVRICSVCGKEFTIKCTAEEYKKQTCSVECMNKLASDNRQIAHMQKTKICEWCGKEFHPRSNTQRFCDEPHYQTCVICGKRFKLEYKGTLGETLADVRKTCSKECERENASQNCAFRREDVQHKIKETMKMRYGVEHPSQSSKIIAKMYATYQDRTGYDHPSHNPNLLKGKNLQVSSIEQKVEAILCNNCITYTKQKQKSKGNIHHKFDFYLDDFKIYLDVDGSYYHGYLDDSNGKQISEDRDNSRLLLIDEDEQLVVVTESNLLRDMDDLLTKLKSIKEGMFDYTENMFKWCRKIEFPYPIYSEKRLKRDYKSLSKYEFQPYNSHCKLGLSTIRHFHKSIYDAKVGNNPSLKEAWTNDTLLLKVIKNRMIYQNNVDPSKVLAGFYISKVVPKVSVFNPVLARYLVYKYLNEFDEILDPFSGFSGRMLGSCSLGKQYTGFDLNDNAVKESREIISFHSLNASVKVENILDVRSVHTGQGLLTCPPYFKKETYRLESSYKSCDEWIELILTRYQCDKYVFVVDRTDIFSKYITETICTRSYFNDIFEYVIVIEK